MPFSPVFSTMAYLQVKMITFGELSNDTISGLLQEVRLVASID
jgi:hypothetical protein